jgi:hypothetical protein
MLHLTGGQVHRVSRQAHHHERGTIVFILIDFQPGDAVVHDAHGPGVIVNGHVSDYGATVLFKDRNRPLYVGTKNLRPARYLIRARLRSPGNDTTETFTTSRRDAIAVARQVEQLAAVEYVSVRTARNEA